MEITDVKIRLNDGWESGVLATASVTLDGCVAVHDICVVRGPGGLLVRMPNRRCADGRNRDVVHPICSSMREKMDRVILKAYVRTRDQYRISPVQIKKCV